MNLRLNYPEEDISYKRAVYKLIEKLKVSGRIRTTNFFYKFAKRGRFNSILSDYTNEHEVLNFCNQIDSMITILNSVHNNNWDFHLEPIFNSNEDGVRRFNIYVVIHYPQFVIANSRQLTHTIQDLLVTFKITRWNGEDSEGNFQNQFLPQFLQGTRATMTYEEWFVGYRHSHLTANKPTSFFDVFRADDFCTGSGEINEVLATLWEEGYSEEHFEMFLHTLNTVAEWESLEGTPYIKMERIGIGKTTNISDMSGSRLKSFYETLYDTLKTYKPSLDANFVFSDNRYRIKLDSRFENFLKQFIIETMPGYWSNLLVMKVNDKYVGYSHPDITSQSYLEYMFQYGGEKPYTVIQDRVLEFSVIPYSGELPDINLYNVHPKLIEYASREFEKQLYTKSVRKSTIEKYYQNNNA